MNCRGLGTGTDGSDGLFLDGVSGTRPRRGKRPSNPQLRGTRGSRVRAVKGKRRPNGSARPASRPPCPAQSPRGRRGGKAAVSQSSRERSTTTTGAKPPTHGTAGPNRQTNKTISPQSLGVGGQSRGQGATLSDTARSRPQKLNSWLGNVPPLPPDQSAEGAGNAGFGGELAQSGSLDGHLPAG